MLEAEIIAHCAPTLAGIKTANMFTYTPMNRNKLSMEIEEENRKLNCRGVFVEVLRTSEYKALVYVYRKKKLEQDLQCEGACALLKDCGYECQADSDAFPETEEMFRNLQTTFCGWKINSSADCCSINRKDKVNQDE